MSSPLLRFELEMLGGAVEAKYRKLRPAIAGLPWGTLADMNIPAEIRLDAQLRWTRLAFNEYASSAAMTVTARAMIDARAPLNLTALCSRFAIDELAHAELGALMAMELGGVRSPRWIPRRRARPKTRRYTKSDSASQPPRNPRLLSWSREQRAFVM